MQSVDPHIVVVLPTMLPLPTTFPLQQTEVLDFSLLRPWFKRLLPELKGTASHQVRGSEASTAYLAALWCHPEHPFWLQLNATQNDPVEWGNTLAQALHNATGYDLAGTGAHYRHALRIMMDYHSMFGPYRIAVSGAQHTPELVQELLPLCELGSEVLVIVDDEQAAPLPFLPLSLDHNNLSVTSQDVSDMAAALNVSVVADDIRQRFKSHLEPIWRELHILAGLPKPLRPTPRGPRFIPGDEPLVPPNVLIDALLKRGYVFEALTTAYALGSDRCPELVEKAGDHAVLRGAHRQFQRILQAIPLAQRTAREWFWLLRVCKWLGEIGTLEQDIASYLERDPDPDLKVSYVGSFKEAEYEAQVLSILEQARTAVTLNHASFVYLESDPQQAIELAKEALEVNQDRSFLDKIQAVQYIIMGLSYLGRIKEARSWAIWSDQQMEECQCSTLELRVRQILVTSRIYFMAGVDHSMCPTFEALKPFTEFMTPELQAFYEREALFFNYTDKVATGQFEDIVRFLYNELRNNENSALHKLNSKQTLLNILLHMERYDEYLEVLQQESLRRPDHEQEVFCLARLYAITQPDQAIPLLHGLLRSPTLKFNMKAIYKLWLLIAQRALGTDTTEAGEELRQHFQEYSDSALTFYPHRLTLPILRPHLGIGEGIEKECQAPLQIRVLGTPQVTINQEHLSLAPRALEIVLALALHPEGLNGEQLLLWIYGDEGESGNLKANISKLRRVIPVDSQPYRLGVNYTCDVLDIETLLNQGELSQAMSLYKGSVLPHSESPGVIEWRERVDEQMRQAVLQRGNGNQIYALGLQLKDLELLYAAREQLAEHDARYPIILSHIQLLEREYS